jgi:DNA-binding transcriptional LysR family regulator
VTFEDLHGLEMIAFDSDLEIRHEIDRVLAAKGVEVRVLMEFDNTETIKRAVEIDAGISLLPQPTIDREVKGGALVARPLSGIDLKRPIGIIQRRGMELGKTAGRFMQLLLKETSTSRAIADSDEPNEEPADQPDSASSEPPNSAAVATSAKAAKPIAAAQVAS